ncbi:MAG: cytidylate kinase family protein [Candidatus Poseidoniaceae archaeon]|nr:cytidylate kinase family protein [Candidatus Poseidoniaceae archaeon]
MVRITISGHPGSGTSTLVEGLSNHFDWSSINGGEIFRKEAAKNGMSLSDFGKLCATDESIDKNLDHILKQEITRDNGPEIVESRLSGWWAHLEDVSCIRMWLSVNEISRAERVVSREGCSVDEALEVNQKRVERDLKRYDKLYGINPEDRLPYTHVIEATTLTAEEILLQVIDIMEELS